MHKILVSISLILSLGVIACGSSTGGSNTCTEHDWSSWTTQTEATCTTEKVEIRTCSLCGEDETQIGTALEHTFLTIPATCITPSIPGTCTREGCDAANPEVEVDALGHEHTSSLVCKRTGCEHQYAIGDTGPGGGKIFYRDEAGFIHYENANDAIGVKCYYLEAAPDDIGSVLRWSTLTMEDFETDFDYELFIDIPGTGLTIGTGRKNTEIILALDASAPAALACRNYSNNGLTDWFLPSKEELNQLWLNKDAVGNFVTDWAYWSSSQLNRAHVWL